VIKGKYLDCLFLLRQALLTLESLEWDSDIIEQVKLILINKRRQHINSKINKNDLNVMENYLECLRTLDKNKIVAKNLKMLS
jgi:hypothetical protein